MDQLAENCRATKTKKNKISRPKIRTMTVIFNFQNNRPIGTDIMILKIFSPKNSAFLTQNKILNIGYWEKRQFFAENCRKSQKIVTIPSTSGPVWKRQNRHFSSMSRCLLVCSTQGRAHNEKQTCMFSGRQRLLGLTILDATDVAACRHEIPKYIVIV
jgi:hypothetical protein